MIKIILREKLSMLWIFALFNYANADLTTLFDPNMVVELVTGALEGTSMLNPMLLFYGAILMEIPMIMIVLSRVLNYKINRYTNIIAGVIKTVAIFLSLFVGTPAIYYIFFASIEFVCTTLIVWYAWKWPNPEG